MLEVFFLFITTGGIAAYARGRGGNPWLWGTISVAGYLAVQFVSGAIIGMSTLPPESNLRLLPLGASLAWVGVIAFCTRFVLGRGRQAPSGMWTCSNCKYLNQHYSLICEACQQPYGKAKVT